MIRIGIICPSEIALRRFLPAVKQLTEFEFAGVSVADRSEWAGLNDEMLTLERKKAERFVVDGGKIYSSYRRLIGSNEIDAIYLPLPPAMHYYWAKQALLAGKHVLVEKPATTSLSDTLDLIDLARSMSLAIHENYMFAFHNQLSEINDIIKSGEIGDVRLYNINFGFPRRQSNDFRYIKSMGGGALLDAGGYTIKYASMLLGDSTNVIYSRMNYVEGFEVDIAGSAALINKDGVTAQVGFGMDNDYRCDLNVWGSKGSLFSGRVLTAPAGYIPEITISKNSNLEVRKLSEDDTFQKSILHFNKCVNDKSLCIDNYNTIVKQAGLVDSFLKKATRTPND